MTASVLVQILPSKVMALLRTHARIKQHSCDVVKEGLGIDDVSKLTIAHYRDAPTWRGLRFPVKIHRLPATARG